MFSMKLLCACVLLGLAFEVSSARHLKKFRIQSRPYAQLRSYNRPAYKAGFTRFAEDEESKQNERFANYMSMMEKVTIEGTDYVAKKEDFIDLMEKYSLVEFRYRLKAHELELVASEFEKYSKKMDFYKSHGIILDEEDVSVMVNTAANRLLEKIHLIHKASVTEDDLDNDEKRQQWLHEAEYEGNTLVEQGINYKTSQHAFSRMFQYMYQAEMRYILTEKDLEVISFYFLKYKNELKQLRRNEVSLTEKDVKDMLQQASKAILEQIDTTKSQDY